MITCTLSGKRYHVDFVSGRALREMEPAAKMYGRIVAISNAALRGETSEEAQNLSIAEAMDEMIKCSASCSVTSSRRMKCWITIRWTGSCMTLPSP